MKLAICAPFMESDLWQERLRRAAPWAALEFDEFYRPEEIRSVPGFRYDAGVVAMKGARGLELATACGNGLPPCPCCGSATTRNSAWRPLT